MWSSTWWYAKLYNRSNSAARWSFSSWRGGVRGACWLVEIRPRALNLTILQQEKVQIAKGITQFTAAWKQQIRCDWAAAYSRSMRTAPTRCVASRGVTPYERESDAVRQSMSKFSVRESSWRRLRTFLQLA